MCALKKCVPLCVAHFDNGAAVAKMALLFRSVLLYMRSINSVSPPASLHWVENIFVEAFFFVIDTKTVEGLGKIRNGILLHDFLPN